MGVARRATVSFLFAGPTLRRRGLLRVGLLKGSGLRPALADIYTRHGALLHLLLVFNWLRHPGDACVDPTGGWWDTSFN